MKQLIQNKKQEHLEFLSSLEKLEIQQQRKELQILQTIYTIRKKRARSRDNINNTICFTNGQLIQSQQKTYESDDETKEESDLDKIVMHKLKEKIKNRKKQNFRCTYQFMSQMKQVSIDIKYYDFLKLNPYNNVNDTILKLFKNISFHGEQKQINTQYIKNNQMLQRQHIQLFPLHQLEHQTVRFVVNPLQVCEQLYNNNFQLSNDVSQNGYLIYFDLHLIYQILLDACIQSQTKKIQL
ncbi:unnamed protein product [Paramecium sonneborni]|uniref:Uncharacterized protein n=1 Tax=Paramecium sonneborni TaxID=65129 RepID=A0A8S1RTX7_9CILI|nr:unnamed protein product [Paramecium sonneborni]